MSSAGPSQGARPLQGGAEAHAVGKAGGEQPRSSGFTLVELLIALAILGVLAVLGYRAVASLTASEAQLASEAERWRTLDLLFAHLESTCRQAVPRSVRTPNGPEPAFLAMPDANGNASIVLSRAGAEFVLEPGSAGQRLGYRLREGNVEVIYWPSYDVADPGSASAYRLAERIASFQASFLDSQGAWHEQWPVQNEPATPRAMRITIATAGGERLERLLVLR